MTRTFHFYLNLNLRSTGLKKKVASFVLGGIKNKKKILPASSVFAKSFVCVEA